MRKKILILGNTITEYSLAKLLAKEYEVYIAPGNKMLGDNITSVDLREDSVSELLDFVLENGIDITIPVSKKTLTSNIVELFTKNNQSVFAPNPKAASIILDKAFAKKVLYKLRIPTPKFGIFEKQNVANDYLKNVKFPCVVKTNEPSSAVVLTSQTMVKPITDSIFVKDNPQIIIEDYVYGTPFCFYTITDGYKALPIGSSIMYKHYLDNDGGQLTNGMGACVPNYKLSLENEYFLMDNVIYPTLDYLEISGNPYIGILGVNGILTEDNNIVILGYHNFTQIADTHSIFSLLDENIYELMNSCIIGSFSDEYNELKTQNQYGVSVGLYCNNKNNKENILNNIDMLDEETILTLNSNIIQNKYFELEVENGLVGFVTTYSNTINSATKKTYNEISELSYQGIHYRKDICKPLIIDN